MRNKKDEMNEQMKGRIEEGRNEDRYMDGWIDRLFKGYIVGRG